jgi:flagellar assembly protein FliH
MPSPEPLVIHFTESPRALYLAGAAPAAPTFSQEQLDEARREAYQRGAAEATHLLEQQMVELRDEAIRLQTETFAAVAAQHHALEEEFRTLLPDLVLAAATRILAGTPIEQLTVYRVVEEMLRGVTEDEGAVEVRLAPRDLTVLGEQDAGFREKHPQLTFRADPELKPGDCVVRSRFGTLDGRVATKLEALGEALR